MFVSLQEIKYPLTFNNHISDTNHHDSNYNFTHQLVSKNSVRYGERFPGMGEHFQAYGLVGTAAVQWREGVIHACSVGRTIDPSLYMELRYEDLLLDPQTTWKRVSEFLGIAFDGPGYKHLKSSLHVNQSPDFSSSEYRDYLNTVEPFIRPTCEYLGYEWV